MTIPRYDEFFVPVLRILADGKIHASGEMLTLLADEFAVTEEERSRLLPSGRSRVLNGRISWARTYLKKAGLIESPKRGTYRITRPGKEALASGAQIDNDYLERYESFRSFKNLNGDSSTHTTVDGGLEKKSEAYSSEETPDEALDRAFSSINMRLADDLLSEVLKLSPIAFERFVLDLMAKSGVWSFRLRKPDDANLGGRRHRWNHHGRQAWF